MADYIYDHPEAMTRINNYINHHTSSEVATIIFARNIALLTREDVPEREELLEMMKTCSLTIIRILQKHLEYKKSYYCARNIVFC